MKLNLLFDNEVILTGEFDDPLQGAVDIVYINPSFESTMNQWLSEEQFILSHDEETGGYAGRTNGVDDIRAFEQRIIALVHELGDGWDYEVIEDVDKFSKGGPGSGHHGHAGRPGERGGSASSEGSSVESDFTQALPFTRIPAPRTLRGNVQLRYDEKDFESNTENHKAIESAVESAVSKIPEKHLKLLKKITIDDDIGTNELPTTTGGTILLRSHAIRLGFTAENVGGYVSKGVDGLTLNANTSYKNIRFGYENIVLHETGHTVFHSLDDKTQAKFSRALLDNLQNSKDMLFGNESSDYNEFFAGMYRNYVQKSEEFRTFAPSLYDMYKNKIFDGEEYTNKATNSSNQDALYIYEIENNRVYTFVPARQEVSKGGPGSGSWDAPGSPRFAWGGEIPSDVANSKAYQVAQRYLQGRGMPPLAEQPKVAVDPERGRRIAEAYESMKNDPNDPEVVAAYKTFGEEINEQYKLLPVKIEWTTEDPYPSSKTMMEDVKTNNRLRVFTGGNPTPLLAVKDESGVSLNDKFRAVHDYFGHSMRANQFGPSGEENAWIDHSKMFSPIAQRAMTTETRGQNSWFNFSTTNQGKAPKDRQFAEQKVGLLPEEFMPSASNKANETIISEGVDISYYCPLHQHHSADVEKGGSGSGSWDGPGQPRFAHQGKPDMAHETPNTPVPSYLKTFDDVKSYLGQGTKVIISAERAHLRPEENERRSIALKRILQNYDENVVSQEGRWAGTAERSYVLRATPSSLTDIEQLAFSENELDQDAIIVIQDGVAELRYRDGNKERGSISRMETAEGNEDNYSKIGNVKFRINFNA